MLFVFKDLYMKNSMYFLEFLSQRKKEQPKSNSLSFFSVLRFINDLLLNVTWQ